MYGPASILQAIRNPINPGFFSEIFVTGTVIPTVTLNCKLHYPVCDHISINWHMPRIPLCGRRISPSLSIALAATTTTTTTPSSNYFFRSQWDAMK